MTLVTLTAAAVLFSAGTYLILQRSLARVVVGLGLVSHGANLLLLSSSVRTGLPPVVAGGDPQSMADPLPQAMVLTAVVITFGVTAFLLALALRGAILTGTDSVEDDVEDRRIAGAGERS
ncbi:MAG: NADH-quinone oxidoreductase subunit K [Acidimicrobiia bacterium]|nr:NADH-quinone oxidoreductase subunit K [Acidimicrobiia bacterium]MDH4309728.1 NADH-quinone oxidoreductase subunit K [Acidimicrobiia bacterium]